MSRYVDLDGVSWDGKPISSKIQEVQTKYGYMQGITIGWLWGDNVPHIDLEEHDKHVIEQYKADTGLNDTIREIHDNVAREMYCKGIDDFMKALITMYERYDIDAVFESSDTYSYTNACYIFEHYIKEIAEQLKAGVNNE